MRMAKDPELVTSFLKDLAAKLQPLKKDEIKLFLEYKKEEVSLLKPIINDLICQNFLSEDLNFLNSF